MTELRTGGIVEHGYIVVVGEDGPGPCVFLPCVGPDLAGRVVEIDYGPELTDALAAVRVSTDRLI